MYLQKFPFHKISERDLVMSVTLLDTVTRPDEDKCFIFLCRDSFP